MTLAATTAALPMDAHTVPARHGEPESIRDILPRVLADFGCQRRKPSPLEEALLDADVRQLAPDVEDADDER